MVSTVPTPWQWQFPECPQWVPDGDTTRSLQLLKVFEEAGEVALAMKALDSDYESWIHYAKEYMNVIHACETALREFPPEFLDLAKREVIKENDARGYYGGSSDG